MTDSSTTEPLFPGRPVELDKVTVTVYPLGVRHIRDFSEAVTVLFGHLAPLLSKGQSAEQLGAAALVAVGPIAVKELSDLIGACVAVPNGSIDDLPHWHFATVLEAWIDESFGAEEKLRPWRQAVTRLAEALQIDFKAILETFSSSSLPADIPGEIS